MLNDSVNVNWCEKHFFFKNINSCEYLTFTISIPNKLINKLQTLRYTSYKKIKHTVSNDFMLQIF